MSALTSTYLANSIIHNLIHWMTLSGVAFDVGDQPASYQIPLPADPSPAASNTYNNVSATRAASAAAPKPVSSAPSVAINIEKFASLDELTAFYSTWKTLGLAKTASRAVLPAGCLTSPKLMVISDIPDDVEDRHGTAFSSPANMTVRKAIQAAGFQENDILYSYLSKWRTPAKRPLTVSEKDICMQLLSQEIALVNPGMILTLGESTIRALVPDSQGGTIKNLLTLTYSNQIVNKEFTVYASPKGEFLLKNGTMKKSFWFSLLDLANRIGA